MVTPDKSIVVTGASGFFGRHLVPFLAARGRRLVITSRNELGASDMIRSVKIDDLVSADWDRHLDGAAAVVHLAGLAHVTSFIPESEYRRVNVLATRKIAEAAERTGAKLLLVSSVAAQSGPTSPLPLSETDNPTPTNAYGRSKLAAEEEVKTAMARDFVILRPTLTYGSGVMGNMGKLISLSMRTVPPPLGSLTNVRSLLAIENLCEAIAFVLDNARANGETFLLSDRQPISVADMARQLRWCAGYMIGAINVPQIVLANTLRWLGRYDLWDKLAGDLVVSVNKLRDFGFSWKVDTPAALRELGNTYAKSRWVT